MLSIKAIKPVLKMQTSLNAYLSDLTSGGMIYIRDAIHNKSDNDDDIETVSKKSKVYKNINYNKS